MRMILASILGTLVVFTWGFATWVVLEIWSDDLREMSPSAATEIRAAIDGTIEESGAYVFPPRPVVEDPGDAEAMAAAEAAWLDEVKAGPTGVLLVHPGGTDPMRPSMFVQGILLEFAGAFLLAVFLQMATRAGAGYGGRVAVGCGVIGFAVVAGVLVPGNFRDDPAGWTRAMAGDLAVGWGLAVLVMAAIIRPSKATRRH